MARIGIVGAGIGGLVAAIELARRGHRVVVLERAAAPGGKVRQVMVGGVPVQAGPALLTLRPVFDALFESCGTRLDATLRLTPQRLLGRHIFADGSRLDLPVEAGAAEAAIGRFAGAAAARGYRGYRARARAAFETLEDSLLHRPRPTALALAAQAGVGRLLATGPFTTLWDALGEHFADARLRQLFARTATYVGASPMQAPATLMLVAEVEHRGGWFIEGGMTRLVQALAALAEAQGAELRLQAEVAEVLVAGGRVSGLRLADGSTIACDGVIANADAAAIGAGRLGAAAARAVGVVAPRRRSFSAITWAMRAEGLPADAPAQTVFHPRDAPAEYAALAFRGRLPAEPGVTLWAESRMEGAAPPAGAESLLAMVNAPARGELGQPDGAAIAACGAQVFGRMAADGVALRRHAEQVTSPVDFEALFPGTGGALYGPAVQGWQATFSRPAARTSLPGLYLAGGSTHPGAGVAMAALSGRLAAASVIGER